MLNQTVLQSREDTGLRVLFTLTPVLALPLTKNYRGIVLLPLTDTADPFLS